jgi:hypothetical protein
MMLVVVLCFVDQVTRCHLILPLFPWFFFFFFFLVVQHWSEYLSAAFFFFFFSQCQFQALVITKLDGGYD